ALTLSGTTSVDAFHTLSLTGGVLNTGDLSISGTFNFTGGALVISGANGLTIGNGGAFRSGIKLPTRRTPCVINQTTVATNAEMLVSPGSSFTTTSSLNVNGEFDLGGTTSNASVASLSNFGLIRGDGRIQTNGAGLNILANKAGGEIRAEAGK